MKSLLSQRPDRKSGHKMNMEGKGAGMRNKLRQRGYSLVELSFVLIIMLVLAGIVSGGGAFMANQAKAQKITEKAREFFIAANHRHAKVDGYPTPPDGNTAALYSALGPYLDNNTTTFQDPYTGANKTLVVKDPAFTTTEYTDGTVKNWNQVGAKVVYFWNTSGTGTFYVRDQDKTYAFKFFAFQAIDADGRATLTIGK